MVGNKTTQGPVMEGKKIALQHQKIDIRAENFKAAELDLDLEFFLSCKFGSCVMQRCNRWPQKYCCSERKQP